MDQAQVQALFRKFAAPFRWLCGNPPGPKVPSSLDSAANVRSDFATRLYHKLADTQEGKNLFLSPFSIRVALAMCAAGAKGETRRVMADLIGAPVSVAEQNRQYAAWLGSVNGAGE